MAHGDALNALQHDDGLWTHAVEEILRLRSPVQIISRQVIAEAEFHGKTLKPGQQVFCMLGSANHDPDFFPDPERFDIR